MTASWEHAVAVSEVDMSKEWHRLDDAAEKRRLLDVHVKGVYEEFHVVRADFFEQFDGILDGVEEISLVAVNRFKQERHLVPSGALGASRQGVDDPCRLSLPLACRTLPPPNQANDDFGVENRSELDVGFKPFNGLPSDSWILSRQAETFFQKGLSRANRWDFQVESVQRVLNGCGIHECRISDSKFDTVIAEGRDTSDILLEIPAAKCRETRGRGRYDNSQFHAISQI